MSESEVSIRRAPRIGVFLIFGAMLGALVTLILTSLFEPDPAVGFLASFAYFCLFGIPAGVALGGVVALALDIVSTRRARTVTVARDDVSDSE
ncbi:potassium transporter Trk [Pseudolysinimonas sp.]|uniref:potassium transporter Trk n=1 Tax=Pseudolysinimonas sp. TaxID=2680009 RepID=UPI00286CB77F|nr:potassium transporter Trk [Pseudolysinimonas sp.]